jgi:hypothetical protein
MPGPKKRRDRRHEAEQAAAAALEPLKVEVAPEPAKSVPDVKPSPAKATPAKKTRKKRTLFTKKEE